MRKGQQLQASTIRRRLAALSSLFGHLVRHGVVAANPVRDVDRPRVSRRQENGKRRHSRFHGDTYSGIATAAFWAYSTMLERCMMGPAAILLQTVKKGSHAFK
jgi:hypothetical protein